MSCLELASTTPWKLEAWRPACLTKSLGMWLQQIVRCYPLTILLTSLLCSVDMSHFLP